MGRDSLNVPFGHYSCGYAHPNNESYATNLAAGTAVKLCWKSRHEIRIPSSPKRALLFLHPLEQANKTRSLGGQRVKTPSPYNLAGDQKHQNLWEHKGQIVNQNHIDSLQHCEEGLAVFKVRETSSST